MSLLPGTSAGINGQSFTLSLSHLDVRHSNKVDLSMQVSKYHINFFTDAFV